MQADLAQDYAKPEGCRTIRTKDRTQMQGRPDDQGNMATREDLCKKGWKQDI